MNKLIKSLILGTFIVAVSVFASPAQASTPILSATYQGSGSQNALITVTNANPYSTINLSYRQSSSLWTVVNNIGQTDQSGYFTQSISMPSDGTGSSIQMYVVVGGLQSSTVSVYANGYSGGCTYNCGTPYGLSLSQNSLSVAAGQSASVTVTNAYSYGYSSNAYISSNSNSSVATASVSGNLITVYGVSSGSANISVCQSSGSSACATLYVTVTGYSNGGCGYYGCSVGGLTLSQTSLSLTPGQSGTVTVSLPYPIYSTNTFYVSSNSNTSVATASASYNQVTVYGVSAGSTSIYICSNSGSTVCATLYVTVTGVLGANTNLWFNPGSASLYAGQSLAVSINSSSYSTGSYYGSSPYYYISSNSNSGAVTASVSGTVLNLYANQSGSSTITVCSSSLSFCGTIYATVTGGSSGTLSLSQTSMSLSAGQSSSATIYGSGSYYVSSNSNSSIASASVTGSILYVNGLTNGSSTITVCQSNYSSQCANLFVTVTGYGGGSTIWFSPSSVNLNLAQTMTVSITGGNNYYTNNYYVSSNSNSAVVTASITGNNLYVYGNGIGNSSLVICQSGYSNCGTLYITVGINYNGGSLSLSQTSVNLSLYQTSNVTIYGGGSNYISSNSNAGVITATISGNLLTLYANSTGSTTVVICQNSSVSCANLYVTVGGSSSNIILSQYSLGLNAGQSATVNVSGAGGYGYYISTNSNPGVVSASFNGSVITIYAIANGSSTLQICQNNASSCQSLYITVGSGYSYSGGNGLSYQGGSGSSVLGASTYPNGQLISEGQTVYMVYKNTKTAFASSYAFTGLGFSFNNVMQVGSSGLVNSGFTVTTPYASHPWGSWIKSGSTVYFVHETGLIPVPDWSTFVGNAGQASFIVKANSYDFKLPILASMTMGDSRLQ